jgi:hypothetical protein
MAKYMIELSEKVETELREHYQRDIQFYQTTKESTPWKTFEEYISYFIGDYLEEIKDGEADTE